MRALTQIRIALVSARERLLSDPEMNVRLEAAISRLDCFEESMARLFNPRQKD
jgi:hypothetical protein